VLGISSLPRNQAVIMIAIAEPGLPPRWEARMPMDAATPPRFGASLADADLSLSPGAGELP